MNKTIYRIASFVVACAILMGNYIHAGAVGTAYYVSITGNDANPGTSSAPFKTFAKANSMLTAGSTLNIYSGTYNEQLKISKSGTSAAWITVKPLGGAVVIDMQNAVNTGLELRGSYINASGLEVRNSGDICVNLVGSNLTVDGLIVHECMSHGIQANASAHVKILNSRVYRAVLSNAGRNIITGWGSAIKIRVSDDVLVEGNVIYNNFGEGMGTRGTNITIRGNTVYDNFSVNIYTNSENVLVERNFVYCTPNSGYERDGLPAAGISMGEEYFEGWGARINNVRILNNIVTFCKHGVRYSGAADTVVGGGLKNSTIAYNTLYGSTNSALSIVYESAQTGSLIANNIIWQADDKLSTVDNTIGLTFRNNLWKSLPSANVRGLGDRVGGPGFPYAPLYSSHDYRPGSSSPAAKAAVDIGIISDFFAKLRGPSFDMGAVQFADVSVTSTASPTVTATPSTIPPTNTLPPVTPTSIVPTTVLPTNTLPPATPTSISPTLVPPTATLVNTPIPSSPTVSSQPTQPTSGETIFNDHNSAFVYSAGWTNVVKPAASGGSFAQTAKNGSSVTFSFTGSSFSIIYKGGPSYRKMDVYVDGVLAATLDEKYSVSTYQLRWDYPNLLATGAHTLKLVFVTTSTTGTNGSVDAVIVR